jgi:hypothetical protein
MCVPRASHRPRVAAIASVRRPLAARELYTARAAARVQLR